MRLIAFILAVSPLLTCGCRLASNEPNPQWLIDFQRTKSLLIQNHNVERAVSDSETISRLQSIYANAKWKPYWHTLPGNLGDRTIDLLDGETPLRHFSYTGSLWETDSYTENRTAELSGTDRQWIESLFAVVSESEMSAVEVAK
jgi:hypothetical protein